MNPEFRSPVGLLHHVELYVGDLERTRKFWGWLLGELGYLVFQEWPEGVSYRLGDTYLVFVQVKDRFAGDGYHRCRIGLNHLAFHVPDRRFVYDITEHLEARNVTILYPERHPRAGGTSYGVFFEDPDRMKVELVAEADVEWNWTARMSGQFGPVVGLEGPMTALTALQGIKAPWGFAGGWGVSLALGRVVRPHEDVDLAILREDQQTFFQRLRSDGWELEVAHAGGLRPLEIDEHLAAPIHSVWAMRPGLPRLEILLSDRKADRLVFRRDEKMVMPVDQAFRRTKWGIPFLASEFVLLFKAKDPEEPKSRGDWLAMLPTLSLATRAWLAEGLRHLSPSHPWLVGIDDHPPAHRKKAR